MSCRLPSDFSYRQAPLGKECAIISLVDVFARLCGSIEDHLMAFCKSRLPAIGAARRRLPFEVRRNRLLIKAVLNANAEKLQMLQFIADLRLAKF